MFLRVTKYLDFQSIAPKLVSKVAMLGVSVICVGNPSCVQKNDKTASAKADSLPPRPDSAATIVSDTSRFTFNPENEFLGLGVKQFGDLDSMIKRKRIRALVPYTHLYYYIDGKDRKGIAFEALNLFEEAINKKLHLYPPTVRVIFIPVARNQVIPLLREGYGDVAYAGISITDERKELVDFSKPSITGLKEIVVGGTSAPNLTTLADLSGKEIYLHQGSSYETAVRKLSDSLKQQKLPPVIIKYLDPYLEAEDILEMVNSGVIPYSATVEDLARLWSKVMDSLVLYDKIPLATEVSYGMVLRKGSPKLKAATDDFIQQNAKGTLNGNILYNTYVKNVKLLPGMYSKKTKDEMKSLRATFQKYGKQYDLDWLLLVGQGYQESLLDQSNVSHVGAVGIMQVLPSTAADKNINIKNINLVDNNIHAGVKYMRFLVNRYFTDPGINHLNQHLLALAAYNCGPARVIQLRRMAKEKKLNPNLWFDNVEIIAAQVIGRETVQYVSNIYKFYASYRALDFYASKRGKKIIQ